MEQNGSETKTLANAASGMENQTTKRTLAIPALERMDWNEAEL